METLIYNISLMAGQTFWYRGDGGNPAVEFGENEGMRRILGKAATSVLLIVKVAAERREGSESILVLDREVAPD